MATKDDVRSEAPAFTPGPWTCSPTDDECHAVVSPPHDAGDNIGPWFTAIVSCVDDAVEDANARLIAAAPELYTCAVVALDYLDTPDSAHSEAQKATIIEALKATIAKARANLPTTEDDNG